MANSSRMTGVSSPPILKQHTVLKLIFKYYMLCSNRRTRNSSLLETLAMEVADICFADTRVRRVAVSVKKLDIFDGRAVPGIRLDLARPGSRGAAPRR